MIWKPVKSIKHGTKQKVLSMLTTSNQGKFSTSYNISTALKVSVLGVILIRIFPHADWILRISPYSVQMRENTGQNKSEYGLFLRSVELQNLYVIKTSKAI